MHAPNTSSQAFIKSLKSSADPPQPGGALKIVLAHEAWKSEIFQFPNKDEVIVDWILSSFARDKANSSGMSSVLQTRYWKLLENILYQNGPSTSRRTSSVWIGSLISRIQFAPIVTTWLSSSTIFAPSNDLVVAFSRCVAFIWPQAAPRTNLDTLMDTFVALLRFLEAQGHRDNYSDLAFWELENVLSSVVASFRKSINNASSKKKVFATFTEHGLSHWLRCIPSSAWKAALTQPEKDEEPPERNLYPSLVSTGMDLLFSADILKDAQDFVPTHPGKAFNPSSNLPMAQVCALPVLFSFYVQSIRKHKHSIFSQGSNAVQSNEQAFTVSFRDCAMKAFDSCYDILMQWEVRLDVWNCALALVETLRDSQVVAYGARNSPITLGAMVGRATAVVADDTLDSPCRDVAVRVLSTIGQIDFEIVVPYIGKILSHLLTSPANSYNQELLRIHLEYHTKTRTLTAYTQLLLTCFSDLSTVTDESAIANAQRMYSLGSSGALFTANRTEDLRKSIKAFVTYTQLPEVVRLTCETLHAAWQLAECECTKEMIVGDEPQGERKRKRTKIDPFTGETDTPTAAWAAVSFALISRLALIVLPALPVHLLDQKALVKLKNSILKAWDLIVIRAIKLSKGNGTSKMSWSMQLASSAGLKLHHALSHSVFRPCLPTVEDQAMHVQTLVVRPDSSPELVVECVRFFFDRGLDSLDESSRAALISALLAYIEPLRQQVGHFAWDAYASTLAKSEVDARVHGAIAMFHLAMDRWLLDLNEHASTAQLNQLANLCLAVMRTPLAEKPNFVTSAWVMKRAMATAAFWELENLRDAFVHAADEKLNTLDDISTSEMIEMLAAAQSASSSPARTFKPWTEERIHSITGVFKFLLSSPTEYIPRQHRNTFFHRAIVADLAVWSSVAGHQHLDTLVTKSSTWIRMWIVRMTEAYAALDVLAVTDNLLDHILRADLLVSSRQTRYQNATLQLNEVIFRQTIQQALRGDEITLKNCCLTLWKYLESKTATQTIAEETLLRFIEAIVSEVPSSEKLSESARASIQHLQQNAEKVYNSKVMTQVNGTENIRTWRACLVLRRWLGGVDLSDRIVLLGQDLFASAVSSGADRSYLKQAFGLLCDELQALEHASRQKQLMLIPAAFVVLYNQTSSSDLDEQDNDINTMAKSLPLEDYSFLLDVLIESLALGDRSPVELRAIVHFVRSFCRFAPPGHIRLTQDHIFQCLRLFAGREIFTSGHVDLCQEVLDTIDLTCSIRAHFLRQMDLSLIWTILSKLLSPSPNTPFQKRPSTRFKILHSICSVTGTIIRLRRDLVSATIPHLAIILRQLLNVLRRPRTQLGLRQSQLVASSLPWWITPSQPCGVDEGRIVARVLTGLEAKTIPKAFFNKSKDTNGYTTNAVPNTGQKSDSLSRPFSKHAPYVLQAYLTAETDVLCTYPLALRRELEPGLSALCGMMSEHGRDALMVQSLDAAGKVAMKELWRVYDKQKYVGKG